MFFVLQTPVPSPWLIADLLTLILSLWALLFLIGRCKRPVPLLLEAFSFVFLYASVFENGSVVQGWYVYGRSLLMIGDVPGSVPLLMATVFLLGLELLERVRFPVWSRPFVLGLFGMLQDFSLDPLAVNQIYEAAGRTSGRWTWLTPAGAANIFGIPVYNFPGWMLIMVYGATFVLLGRWWYRRSGENPLVGIIYPPLAFVLALTALGSPLSAALLWPGPWFHKGEPVEWVMLAVHLIVPLAIILFVRRSPAGSRRLSWQADWPLFAIPALFHLADLAWAAEAHERILPLAAGATAVHLTLLASFFALRAFSR